MRDTWAIGKVCRPQLASVGDVEGVTEGLVELDSLDSAKMANEVGVEAGDRHGDEVVAADDAGLRQSFVCADFHF